MSNPLLEQHELPPFSKIEVAHIEEAIGHLIDRNRQAIDTLLVTITAYTWDTFLAPIEEMEDELGRAWSPVGHLSRGSAVAASGLPDGRSCPDTGS